MLLATCDRGRQCCKHIMAVICAHQVSSSLTELVKACKQSSQQSVIPAGQLGSEALQAL